MIRAAAPVAATLSLAAVLWAALQPAVTQAAPLDLASVTCARYENEIVAATGTAAAYDPIDTVMWLFGFSVARAGERSMFGDSLPAFGFALDAQCRNHPTMPLLDAVVTIKSKRDNPMDLTSLSCTAYETRHAALRKSDPESSNTLTMWLYGYSVGLADGHLLDAGSLDRFDAGLEERCTAHPADSLYDVLNTANRPGTQPRRRPAQRNP